MAKPRAEDLTGQVFGFLTAEYRCENKVYRSGKSVAQWMCVCTCGKHKKVPAHMLKNGHTTSCGHARIKDLTGQRFGRLVVKELFARVIQPSGQLRVEWLCVCDCGEETVVSSGNLSSGHTTSCGCLRCSAAEAHIKRILNDNKIPHIKEYLGPDLVASTGRLFRFDFALLDENRKLLALLEYQGAQHFIETPGFEEYGAGQRYVSDPIKKDYCKTRNIPLYEITYLEDIDIKMKEILYTVYGNTVPSTQEIA